MPSVAELIAVDLAAISGSGDVGRQVSYNETTVTGFVCPVFEQDNQQQVVTDRCELVVLTSAVAQPTYRDKVTIDGAVWFVQSWRTELAAYHRITLRKNERPVPRS